MSSEAIKRKFEFYRKWFHTFLVKEFLNLPFKYQERFMLMLNKFVKDCKRVHEEAENIKEMSVKVIIDKVVSPDNKTEKYIVYGTIEKTSTKIKIMLPATVRTPIVGKKLDCTVYNMGGDVWYSSKEEMITGRKK